ncbi:MAG: hypothetical protein ACPG21_03855 [Crocinitomicaceae bacterium]
MKRFLLFEAGSTKTTLSIVSDMNTKKVETFMMSGFNPNRPDERFLDEVYFLDLEKGDRVVFYGSGLGDSSNGNAHPGKDKLADFFLSKGITEIEIENDMLGAARALFYRESGLFVIMGTGSVSGFYSGDDIVDRQGGHGYLIDDIGGGYELGKRIVSAWLNDRLEPKINSAIEDHFQVAKDGFTSKYYQDFKDDPKIALAEMAKVVEVCSPFKEEIILSNIIANYFDRFIEDTVKPLADEHAINHFGAVGSIAHHFRTEMETAAKNHRLTVKDVLQYPSEKLIDYHLNYIS